MGFDTVVGLDTSRELLAELRERTQSRQAVRTLHQDLLGGLHDIATSTPIDIAVCMRDTLLHLPDHQSIDRLFDRVAAALGPGGSLVLSYRDLSEPLNGLDRFLPVRSDADRIITRRSGLSGYWHGQRHGLRLHPRRLRLATSQEQLRQATSPPGDLADRAERAGLTIAHHAVQPDGMWLTAARAQGSPRGRSAADVTRGRRILVFAADGLEHLRDGGFRYRGLLAEGGRVVRHAPSRNSTVAEKCSRTRSDQGRSGRFAQYKPLPDLTGKGLFFQVTAVLRVCPR